LGGTPRDLTEKRDVIKRGSRHTHRPPPARPAAEIGICYGMINRVR
jgi:hypothetical protein